MGGQINTKVGSSILYGFSGPAELSHTCLQCLYVCLCVFHSEELEVVFFCSLHLGDLPPSYHFFSNSQPLFGLYAQPPVSRSVCLSIHLQLLSEFSPTALWQIQIYDLRNEARLSLCVDLCAAIPFLTHGCCSSPVLLFCHHPWGHHWPTTQVFQATTINAKPL